MEKFNYSVIIPHYNIPDLLERCLLSIPVRKEIQVLVVDNNSTQPNRERAQDVCSRFEHVQYVQDNIGKGAGHARNIGLGLAEGKWILFADADDFFEPSFWNFIDHLTGDTDADILYAKVNSVNSDTLETQERKTKRRLNGYVSDFLNDKDPYAEDRMRLLYNVPWGKILRKSLIDTHNIRFEEVPTSNDVMFSTISGFNARSVKATECVMYVVTVRSGSLLTRKDKQAIRCRYEVALRQHNYCVKHGKSYFAAYLFTYIKNALLQYGLKEFVWYIRMMWKYRTNPLYGISRRIKEF